MAKCNDLGIVIRVKNFWAIRNQVTYKSENSMHACYALYKGVKAVAQYDMSGKLLNIFPSRREAARQLDIDDSGISQAISGAIRTYKGYIWKDVQVNNL